MKKKKKTSGLITGAPSGLVISLLVHAAAFMLAGLLVVFTVHQKEEKKFVPPKPVERPKMKLRKPKVKVKKTAKPKPSTRIVTKVKRASMPDIQLPEMSGMGDGLGEWGGGGFDMMPDLDQISVFGGGRTIGSDFEGTLYNLMRNRKGGIALMDDEQFRLEIRKFCKGGWKESDLARYYQAPKKLHTTHFMVPPIVAPMAPDAFGDPEMQSYWFFVKYKGQLVCKEDIKFRFWGQGDAFILIRVDGEHVLVQGWNAHLEIFDFWQSFDADNDKYYIGSMKMKVGDWIELKAGEPLDMEVLFGEWRGGYLSAALLVEVEGVDYPSSRQGGPLLPIFKTEELSQDVQDEIMKYLAEGEADLTTGPVFNDYHSPAPEPDVASAIQPVAESVPTGIKPDEAEKGRSALRVWTMVNGRTFKAEFVAIIGRKVSVKKPKGKLFQIPVEQFSAEDLKFIQLESPPQLDIEFSKLTKQRRFPDTHDKADIQYIPRSSYYDFSVRIKQTSTVKYDQELTAEFFAVGDEVTGNKHILLDYQRVNFTLTRENDKTFEFSGKTTELIDYNLNGQRRGTKFGGYLVLITDSRGDSITYKTTKGAFYENLENLRKIPVGRYFDKTCTRCIPTRPKPWY